MFSQQATPADYLRYFSLLHRNTATTEFIRWAQQTADIVKEALPTSALTERQRELLLRGLAISMGLLSSRVPQGIRQ